MSLPVRRSSVGILLSLALVFPSLALAQKGKSQNRKDVTPRGVVSGELIYGVTTTNVLVSFNSAAPGSILSAVGITGLQAGESILGMDFRPVTRQLYLLGTTSRLYTVNPLTGASTAVNGPFTPALSGTAFGFDFNPVVDRIRVVSDLDQNLRLNPDTGANTAVDSILHYTPTDINAGANPNVVGSAYTNNSPGTTVTTLLGIDSNLDILVNQNPPNAGDLTTLGALGVDTSDLVGFDVSRVTGNAYASLTAPAAASSGLYFIAGNGAATLIGTIGGGATIRDISVAPVALAGDLIISEFRLHGPAGASDEFVEIYNPSSASLTVATFDGSAGFALAASVGGIRFTIPNGTVIPAGGHYLGVNSAGYSLGTYPAGNGTTATGNATYTVDIPDNVGIALFNTANTGNFNIATRLDAVGSTTEANGLYKEGNGYPPLATDTAEYSLFRNLRSGVPQDTDNNFVGAELPGTTPQNDFVYADTTAAATPAGQRLGAPGPENLSSPLQRSSTIKASLIFPCVSSSLPPNRVRNGSGNSGTLEIRRKFTNNSSQTVTRLRFRVVDITTAPAPVGTADLRAISSGATVVSDPCTMGMAALQALTLETPPTQAIGGGFNSTLSAGIVTTGTPIAPGASINVNFTLNINQAGNFRYLLIVEALP